jgi:hypothetical protein
MRTPVAVVVVAAAMAAALLATLALVRYLALD